MENRHGSYSRSPGGRQSSNRSRGSNPNDNSRESHHPGGKRRFFKKRSSASDSKMPPPRPGSRPKSKKPWDKVKRIRITSEFQVTDGRHQGTLLENIAKINANVSSRKLRETMFKVLSRKIRAGRFLDLCAGNGTMGIEALSRGAMLGTFVERSARMRTCIQRNLEKCGVKDGHFEIVGMEAVPFLRRIGRRRRFWDIVYCGSPCDADYDQYLRCFGNGYGIRPGGLLVIEHSADKSFPERIGLLKLWRVIPKDDVAVSVYDRV